MLAHLKTGSGQIGPLADLVANWAPLFLGPNLPIFGKSGPVKSGPGRLGPGKLGPGRLGPEKIRVRQIVSRHIGLLLL